MSRKLLKIYKVWESITEAKAMSEWMKDEGEEIENGYKCYNEDKQEWEIVHCG
jgi:hypothetical protein